MTADRETEWGDWASGRPVGPISQTENINGRIRHRIPKPTPAGRPRAAHKLGLQGGDEVELVGWQRHAQDQNLRVGETFVVGSEHWQLFSARNNPKGYRPLFRVISRDADSYDLSDMPEFRAADAKPDYVIGSGMSGTNQGDSTKAISYMLRCTFPHGSDTGTVTREKL